MPEDLNEELQFISSALQEMIQQFFLSLPAIISALVIFFLAIYASSLASRGVRRALRRRKVADQPMALMGKITYWSVFILGTVVALQQVGFNLTAFLTGLGVVGFTVGFALQDVSKNFVSGLILWVQQPFSIGELIEVAPFTGTVTAIDLRVTEIKTLDGRLVLIPNADVLTKPITNFSRAPLRMVEMNLGVAFNNDLETVRRVALQAVGELAGLRKDPPPSVNFMTISAAKVDLAVHYWVDTTQTTMPEAKDSGLKAIKAAFEQAGIEMV